MAWTSHTHATPRCCAERPRLSQTLAVCERYIYWQGKATAEQSDPAASSSRAYAWFSRCASGPRVSPLQTSRTPEQEQRSRCSRERSRASPMMSEEDPFTLVQVPRRPRAHPCASRLLQPATVPGARRRRRAAHSWTCRHSSRTGESCRRQRLRWTIPRRTRSRCT